MVKKVVITETTKTEHIEESEDKEKTPTTHVKKKYKKRKYKKHKKVNSSGKKRMTASEREEMLIENFVGLQHAMTNLSIKFGALSDNISNLLMVFEEAAKNFAQGGGGNRKDDKDMLRKINMLLEQNKTVAKGLVLMEGKLRGRADFTPGKSPKPTLGPPSGMTPSYLDTSRPKPRPLPSI